MKETKRKTRPDFGERITNLRFQYPSQKALADSLGISVRTLRRWESRTDPPAGGSYDEKKIRRRERYRAERQQAIMKEATERVLPAGADPIRLNDLMPFYMFGAEGQETLDELRDHGTHIIRQVIGSGRDVEIEYTTIITKGEKEIYIVPRDDFMQFREQGTTSVFDFGPLDSWLELEAAFWDGFRKTYK